jgi:hypothetical protein
MSRISRFVTIVLALFAIFGSNFVTAQQKSITVFAAASMKNALDDINAAFTKSGLPSGAGASYVIPVLPLSWTFGRGRCEFYRLRNAHCGPAK